MAKASKKRSTVSPAPAAAARRARPAAEDAASKKAGRGSKQSRVLAMLQSPAGATIAAMMKMTAWQPHSVRGFLAGVVRRRLKLKLSSTKTDGVRIYRIADAGSGKAGPRASKRPTS